MKEILKKGIIIATALIFLMLPAAMAAQGFDDDVDDEPDTPIDNMIVVALAIGAGLGYYFLKKGEKAIV